jgi:membrane associated rhomboid family serine protease
MLYLWIFGNNIEDKVGKIRFILFYLLCGGAAAAAQLWLDPHATVPMLGASGAISGVLGAYLLLFPKARILTLVPFVVMWAVQIPAFYFLFFWIGIQLLNGLPMLWIPQWQEQAGVAWWAHIGGFAAGLLLIPFFRIGRK